MTWIHRSDTWGAKRPAFASHHRTASGIHSRWKSFAYCFSLRLQRIRTIPNISNPERQFLERGLYALQTLKTGIPIPAPEDAFSLTEFDVVIYRDRVLGKGGFGAVFEGNWHGTKVAIKRILNFHPAVSKLLVWILWVVIHIYLACYE